MYKNIPNKTDQKYKDHPDYKRQERARRNILNESKLKVSNYHEDLIKHCCELVSDTVKEKVYPNLLFITQEIGCPIDDVTPMQIDDFLRRADICFPKERPTSTDLTKKVKEMVTETIPFMFRILRFYQLSNNPVTNPNMNLNDTQRMILQPKLILNLTQFLIRVSSQTDQRFLQYIKAWNLEKEIQGR